MFLPKACIHTLAEVQLCLLLDPRRQNGSCSLAPSSIVFNLPHTSFHGEFLQPHHNHLPFTYLFIPSTVLIPQCYRKVCCQKLVSEYAIRENVSDVDCVRVTNPQNEHTVAAFDYWGKSFSNSELTHQPPSPGQ